MFSQPLFGDNYIDFLSNLCEEWKQLEKKTTIIVDQKLSEIRDKKIVLSKHVQEAKNDLHQK